MTKSGYAVQSYESLITFKKLNLTNNAYDDEIFYLQAENSTFWSINKKLFVML
eukprot:UN28678